MVKCGQSAKNGGVCTRPKMHFGRHSNAGCPCGRGPKFPSCAVCAVCKAEYNAIWYYRNTKSRMLHAAKMRAREHCIPFSLMIADIPDIPNKCPVLGIPLATKPYARGEVKRHRDESPSLDRIVNIRGYVKGNVRVISQRANRLKADATPMEMFLIAADMLKKS